VVGGEQWPALPRGRKRRRREWREYDRWALRGILVQEKVKIEEKHFYLPKRAKIAFW
jgi:hypothetical protein